MTTENHGPVVVVDERGRPYLLTNQFLTGRGSVTHRLPLSSDQLTELLASVTSAKALLDASEASKFVRVTYVPRNYTAYGFVEGQVLSVSSYDTSDNGVLVDDPIGGSTSWLFPGSLHDPGDYIGEAFPRYEWVSSAEAQSTAAVSQGRALRLDPPDIQADGAASGSAAPHDATMACVLGVLDEIVALTEGDNVTFGEAVRILRDRGGV